ncbi:MAG: diguanylate cyclase [Lachnospiraceae bacterium]|nr:diguanylate cyclase [Lachnospiraceae bacterium]
MSTSEDQMESEPKLNGIRIKIVNYIFILILSLCAIVLLIISHNIFREYLQIRQLNDDHARIQHDAENVHEASDDLTKDVQLFVMWGDTAYLDDYFKEANETRRREAAINDLKDLNVSDELVKLLEHSVEQSMELMQLEYEAMRYAAEGYHLNISDLPQEVQDTVLPAGAEKLSDEEKLDKAEDLVFGNEYYGYKNRIKDYEKQCLDRALSDVSTKEAIESEEMRRLLLLLYFSLAVVCLVSVLLFITISRMIVIPLNHAVASITAKNRIDPLKGTYEIKYMSHVYNEFYHDSIETQKQLKIEAERDMLTGVLNRRGHKTVTDALSSEKYPIALLLVDIDRFKYVNDTYGHEMGDTALKKLAKILLETFRSTDITSRIGGDEFVVIMADLTEANKDIIEEKARIVNERMSVPGPDECPPLTVSIGCAFSDAGYRDSVFKKADIKMYEVKHTGGNGIRF